MGELFLLSMQLRIEDLRHQFGRGLAPVREKLNFQLPSPNTRISRRWNRHKAIAVKTIERGEEGLIGQDSL